MIKLNEMYGPDLAGIPLSWILASLAFAYAFYRLLQVGKRDPRMPPGPPTLPIIGNLHQVPVTGIHKKFKEWSDQYGGVFSLKFGPSTMIVLCDRKAVHDLLDKKGSIYSDRPFNYIASLVTHGDSFPFMNLTQRWRSQRKIASHTFSPRMVDEKISIIQDAEISMMMRDMLQQPKKLYHHVLRTTSSSACAAVWGHRGSTYENFWGHGVYTALDQYSNALETGANPPVDEFPFLRYIPDSLAPWKRRAKQSFNSMDAVWKEARRYVDERRATGIHRNCIIDKILDGETTLDFEATPNQLNHFLGILVEGGADTTASSILTSLLYLTNHPEVQEKARKEIDRVCGPDRLPAWSDFNEIPYVNCVMKEAMRIHPVLPIGVPHRVNQDDWYQGMLIPKDSMVTIPVWAIHHSKSAGYDDPTEYNPDRFIGYKKLASELAGTSEWENRDHYGYGAGRRVCPGMHLAERTQWRMTARILWAFELLPLSDPLTGKPVMLDTENYKEGLNHCPKPFEITIKPRSQGHIDTILREAKISAEVLKQYDD